MHRRRLVGGGVVQHHVDGQVARHGGVDELEEADELDGTVPAVELEITSPVATFSAANKSVIP